MTTESSDPEAQDQQDSSSVSEESAVSPPSPTAPRSQGPVDLSALTTVLTALPEQIARSVREAVGTPQAVTRKSPEESVDKTEKAETKKEKQLIPTKKSFRDWWFG